MSDSVKRVMMFIGMVVGAGFATGREISLYFYGASMSTIILAGALMGVMFGVFLSIGRAHVYQYIKTTRIGKLIHFVMNISIILSFVIMCSGAEELLYTIFHLRYLGIATGVVVAIISSFNMGKIKMMNTILVPILIVLILVISRGSETYFASKFMPINSITYVGMNMLMGGYLILEDGEDMTNRDIVISSIIVAVIFSSVLGIISRGIEPFYDTSMPLYELALSKGKRMLGGSIIYIALLTTMLGNAKLIFDSTYALIGRRSLCILAVAMLAIMSYFCPFQSTLDVVYKVEGIVGSVFVIYVVVTYAYRSLRER